MARKINLDIDAGATFLQNIELTDDENQAYDVTGTTAVATMYKHSYANTVYTFTVTLTEGNANVYMSANTTNTIPEGLYKWKCELTEPSGVVKRIVSGMVTVTES